MLKSFILFMLRAGIVIGMGCFGLALVRNALHMIS